MAKKVIPGLKLIYSNMDRVNEPDDPSFPFKLEGIFSHADFMKVAMVMMFNGNQEIILRAMTKEALDEFIEINRLRTHPRLRHITITGPDGFREEIKGRMG